jgi:hypothetical protein
MISSQRRIEEAYARIRKHSSEDPGTAGDQGEKNWCELLKEWLPRYFHVVNKGIIITDSGYASPQIDVLVLSPSYPPLLLDEKRYLAGGVVAAFECKTTLRAEHIKEAVKTSAELRRHLPKRSGTPYKELHSTIFYGLLAHSHSWKDEGSTPLDNIERALIEADETYVQHPIECIDLITVGDLASWTVFKLTYTSQMLAASDTNNSASTFYFCSPIAGKVTESDSAWLREQRAYFSPLGVLVSVLYSKLAWTFPDMRSLEEYFRKIDLLGRGRSKGARLWELSIYSEPIRPRILSGQLSNGISFDEWSLAFM